MAMIKSTAIGAYGQAWVIALWHVEDQLRIEHDFATNQSLRMVVMNVPLMAQRILIRDDVMNLHVQVSDNNNEKRALIKNTFISILVRKCAIIFTP